MPTSLACGPVASARRKIICTDSGMSPIVVWMAIGASS
jgi:hypothetical protein